MLPTFRTPYAYDLSSTNTPATTDTTLGLPIGIGRRLPPVFTARKSSTTLASTPNPITSSTTSTTTPLVTYTKTTTATSTSTSTATTTSKSQPIQSIEFNGSNNTLNLTLGVDSDPWNATNLYKLLATSTTTSTTGAKVVKAVSTTLSTFNDQKIDGETNVTTRSSTTTGTTTATPTITTTATRLDFKAKNNQTLVTTLNNTTLDTTGDPQTTTSTTTTTSVTGGTATNSTTNATFIINSSSRTVTLTTTNTTTGTSSTTYFSNVDRSRSTNTTTVFVNETDTLAVNTNSNGSVLVHQTTGKNASSTTYAFQNNTLTSTSPSASIFPPFWSSTVPTSTTTYINTVTATGTTITTTGSLQATIASTSNPTSTSASTTTSTILLNVKANGSKAPTNASSPWYANLTSELNATLDANNSDPWNATNLPELLATGATTSTTGAKEVAAVTTTIHLGTGHELNGTTNLSQKSNTTNTGTTTTTKLNFTANDNKTLVNTLTTTTKPFDPTSTQTKTSTTTTTSVTGSTATNSTTPTTTTISITRSSTTGEILYAKSTTTSTTTATTTTINFDTVEKSRSTTTTTALVSTDKNSTLFVNELGNGSLGFVNMTKTSTSTSTSTLTTTPTASSTTLVVAKNTATTTSSPTATTSTYTDTATTTTTTGSLQVTISSSSTPTTTSTSTSTPTATTSTSTILFNVEANGSNPSLLANGSSAWFTDSDRAKSTGVNTTLRTVSGETFQGVSNLTYKENGTLYEFKSNDNQTSVTTLTTTPESGSLTKTSTTTTTAVLSGHGTTSTTTAAFTTDKSGAFYVTTTTPTTTKTATVSSTGTVTFTRTGFTETITAYRNIIASHNNTTVFQDDNRTSTLAVTKAPNGSAIFVNQTTNKTTTSSTTWVVDSDKATSPSFTATGTTTTTTGQIQATISQNQSQGTSSSSTTSSPYTPGTLTLTGSSTSPSTSISTTTPTTIVLNASVFASSNNTNPSGPFLNGTNEIPVTIASLPSGNTEASTGTPEWVNYVGPLLGVLALGIAFCSVKFNGQAQWVATHTNVMGRLRGNNIGNGPHYLNTADLQVLNWLSGNWRSPAGYDNPLLTAQSIISENIRNYYDDLLLSWPPRPQRGDAGVSQPADPDFLFIQPVTLERIFHRIPAHEIDGVDLQAIGYGVRRLNGDSPTLLSNLDTKVVNVLYLLAQIKQISVYSDFKKQLLSTLVHSLLDIGSDKNLSAESIELLSNYIMPTYESEIAAYVKWRLEKTDAIDVIGGTNLTIGKLNSNAYTWKLNFHEEGTQLTDSQVDRHKLVFFDSAKPLFVAPYGSEVRTVLLDDAHFQYNSTRSSGKQMVTLSGNGGTTFNIATGQGDDTFVITNAIFTDAKSVVNILGGSGKDTFVIFVKDGWQRLPGSIHIWDFDPTMDTIVFATQGSFATTKIDETKRTLFSSTYSSPVLNGDGTVYLHQGKSDFHDFFAWFNDVGFGRNNSLYKAAQHEFQGDGVALLKLDVDILNAGDADRIFKDSGTFRHADVINPTFTKDIPANTQTGAELIVNTKLNTQFSQLETSNDHDYFRVYLQKGRSYMFLMEHRPNIAGDGVLSTSLKLKDTKGNDINPSSKLVNRSHWGNWGNTRIDFFASEDGYYFLDASGDPAQYTGKNAGTQTTSKYSISAMEITHQAIDPISETKSSFTAPINHVGYKMNLSAGDYMQIDFDTLGKDIGLNMSIRNADRDVLDPYASYKISTKSTLSFLVNKSGDYFIDALAATAVTNTNFVLSSVKKEVEGSRLTNAVLEENNLIFNKLETKADHDWFRVSLLAGKNYQFDMKKTTAGYGGLDTFLNLRDLNGKVLASHDDISMQNRDSRLVYFNTLKGDYFIDASSWSEKSSGDYSLSYKVI